MVAYWFHQDLLHTGKGGSTLRCTDTIIFFPVIWSKLVYLFHYIHWEQNYNNFVKCMETEFLFILFNLVWRINNIFDEKNTLSIGKP